MSIILGSDSFFTKQRPWHHSPLPGSIVTLLFCLRSRLLCCSSVFFHFCLSFCVFFSLSFSLWGLSLAFIKPGRSCVHASRNEARSVRDHRHRGPWSAAYVSYWSSLQYEEMINSVRWKRHRFHMKWLFLIWPLNF